MTETTAKKVLIVDDHFLFREGLISLFRFTPEFEVIDAVGSVQEAIQKAEECHPDIILMDFSLPDGTGLDASRVILSEYPECSIVFLTVSEADDNVIAALRLGAKGYMIKNIAGADLIAGLKAIDRGESAISRKMMSRVLERILTNSELKEDKSDLLQKLSPRELDVLQELASGSTNMEIGRRLFLTENTVKHHVRNIFDKLGVSNRQEAATFARHNGFAINHST